jgi:sec-independent protein translocase protein TatA
MFDPSAPHIIILLVVVLLLFGSTRLPGAADSLGRAMHIFKKSVKGEDGGKQGDATTFAQPAQPEPQQLTGQAQQAQIDALQRQLSDLQKQSAGGENGSPAGQDTRTL